MKTTLQYKHRENKNAWGKQMKIKNFIGWTEPTSLKGEKPGSSTILKSIYA